MALELRADGVSELQADLHTIMAALQDIKAVQDIAAEAANLAQSFAPKRTGKLAASIRPNKAKNKAIVRAGGTRVPYAAPINYGWRKRNIEPALFMQRADQAMKTRAPQLLQQAIDKLIQEGNLS